MILPGYDEKDSEFYGRAADNSSRNGRTGRHPLGAVKPVESQGAGDVTVRRPDGGSARSRAYTPKELNAIIEQGSKRPRQQTHDEMEMTRANRRAARGDLQAMESWYKAEVHSSTKGKRLQKARGGPEDKTLQGIELGDTFWMAKVW